MIKSLLIGTNGSRWSQAAVDLGLSFARKTNAAVTFLAVVDVPSITAGEPVPIGAAGIKAERDVKLLAEMRERMEQALERAAEQARFLGIEPKLRLAEGSPEEELGKEMQRHDLLVIGKKAVPETDRDPPPSKTLTAVLRHASRPVVVAGGNLSGEGPVLVAYDGGLQAAHALSACVASGLHAGDPIHVVAVGDDAARMGEIAQQAMDFLALHDRAAEAHVLPLGKGVADTLADAASRLSASLMVMGVYGQPRVKEMLFGSVTRSILARVPVPLFLAH